VSCPDAAARGAVGSADAVAGAADADGLADGEGAVADVADVAEELLDVEHPASATSVPVTTAARAGRTPRKATDDIA
jgi:hypothetical protein